jgi:hypothetical protein
MRIKDYQLLYKCIVGSHSYGTNVEGSDVDYKGVYIQTPKDVLYNGYVPQIQVGKDETYYEVGRFLELCETANPTVLELLYSPEECIVYEHPTFNKIRQKREMFLSKRCRLSFGDYAIQQIRKARGLDKKMNWEKERFDRKDILDFCYIHEGCGSTPVKEFLEIQDWGQGYCGLVALPHMRDCYALYYDESGASEEYSKDEKSNWSPGGIAHDILKSNDVSLTSVPKWMVQTYIPRTLYFNKDAYSIHCQEYKEYQTWLKNRNTQRYVDIENHGQQIDGKNMLHCVRLIETAIEIPRDKVINVRRPNGKYLVEIRQGKYDLQSILAKCEEDIKSLDKVFDDSNLPLAPNPAAVKSLAISVREAYEDFKTNKEMRY